MTSQEIFISIKLFYLLSEDRLLTYISSKMMYELHPFDIGWIVVRLEFWLAQNNKLNYVELNALRKYFVQLRITTKNGFICNSLVLFHIHFSLFEKRLIEWKIRTWFWNVLYLMYVTVSLYRGDLFPIFHIQNFRFIAN